MPGRRVGRLAFLLVAVVAAALFGPALAGAARALVISTTGSCCVYNHSDYRHYTLQAGTVALFDPGVGEYHNVTAAGLGADGRPLFRSVNTRDAPVPVVGTDYLQPGTYDFYCSIHGYNVMHGFLDVVGSGARPRPTVEVAILSKRLRQVRRTGLFVSVRPSVASGEIVLTAKRGDTVLAQRQGVAAGAGETRNLPLYLTPAGRRALRGLARATIRLEAGFPFSSLGSTARRLQ